MAVVFSTFVDPFYRTDVYILSADGRALVIDPATDAAAVRAHLSALGAVCGTVVLTHGHADHAACAAALERDGAEIFVHARDAGCNGSFGSLAVFMGLDYTRYRTPKLLADGDEIAFSDLRLRVLHTPGHTRGGICLYADAPVLDGEPLSAPARGLLFSGDTLFCNAVGRTDLPGGSADALESSLSRLFALPDARVYPGHGKPTTLGAERARFGARS